MKVLLAIDASQASKYVVDEAVARPWPEATEFSIVNVVDLQPAAKLPAIIEDAKREGQKVVKAAAEILEIRVLGLVIIADDVTPELALQTIGSITVLGIRYPSSGAFTTIPVITP